MFYAFYFALHFVGAFLGLIIAMYMPDMAWIGLGIFFTFLIKFVIMLPDLNERTDR